MRQRRLAEVSELAARYRQRWRIQNEPCLVNSPEPETMAALDPDELITPAYHAEISLWAQQSRHASHSTSSDCSAATTGYANSRSTPSTITVSEPDASYVAPKPRTVRLIRPSKPGMNRSQSTDSSTFSVPLHLPDSDQDVAPFDPDAAFIASAEQSEDFNQSEEEEVKSVPGDGFFIRCWKRVKSFVKTCLQAAADRL